MNITYKIPNLHTNTLGDMTNSEVFRFPNSKTPCMRINFDGNEVFQAYHFYYDMEDALDECIIVHQKELYVWNGKQEQLDYEYYQQSEALNNLLAYVLLDTGKIYISHMNEQVISLKADLTVEEKN